MATKKTEQINEVELMLEEKSLKAQLDAMPKKELEIPEDPVNPDDVAIVGWNGIVYAIPRGQSFMVPEPIYNIWKESQAATKAAQRKADRILRREIEVY